MSKSVNLTVRLEADFKKDFDVACEYLGRQASDVVRRAIRQTIDEYRKSHKVEREYASNFLNENIEKEMYEMLKVMVETKRNTLKP